MYNINSISKDVYWPGMVHTKLSQTLTNRSFSRILDHLIDKLRKLVIITMAHVVIDAERKWFGCQACLFGERVRHLIATVLIGPSKRSLKCTCIRILRKWRVMCSSSGGLHGRNYRIVVILLISIASDHALKFIIKDWHICVMLQRLRLEVVCQVEFGLVVCVCVCVWERLFF